MKKIVILLGLAAFAFVGRAVAAEKGFESIFDGKTLDGWDGNPKFWSVEDGAITGKTTKENPTKGNTFIIWNGGKTGDFDLRLDYKIVGGNSGIQYRSFNLKNKADKWRVGGYQADIDSSPTFSGICYGEAFRGILSFSGSSLAQIPMNHQLCPTFSWGKNCSTYLKQHSSSEIKHRAINH